MVATGRLDALASSITEADAEGAKIALSTCKHVEVVRSRLAGCLQAGRSVSTLCRGYQPVLAIAWQTTDERNDTLTAKQLQ